MINGFNVQIVMKLWPPMFDNTTEIIGAVAKRTSVKGKQATANRRKKRYGLYDKDPEIQRELDRHGSDNVHVIQ